MTPERWKQVKDILSLALKRPSEQRAAVLNEACGDNASLRHEIEELLECQHEMGSFLEEPLFGEVDAPSDEGVPRELQEWDRYQVLERLGRGGMAVVYKAWDPRLQRPVAIKFISGGDDLTVKRFLREAEAQARINHDNVLKIYETGVAGGHHYIAMHCVSGPTLLGVREETTLEQKVELMLKIAEGLHAAHRQGLVHRDIKPGNILVEHSPEGLKPYLLDFGLAVEVGAPGLTKTGVVVGTPRYMAPERIQEDASVLDRRSDIYSLGATFYEFISGVAPFAGTSGLQVLVDVLRGDVRPLRSLQPRLSPELDAIIMKCLEKEPQHRYPSARAFADDLRRYLDGDPILARPTGILGRLAKKARKNPRLTTAFLTLISLIVVVGGWGAYGYWRATRQAELAQKLGQEIRDIEWLFRAAQMSPLHAITTQKQQVRQRMSRLAHMMDEIGSLAYGPGHYAQGRGFLTLGDYPKALEHLERAWKSGYQTADTAAALGVVHGELYRLELAKAQRIGVARQREERVRQLQVAHRDQALDFLQKGRSSSIMPAPYVEALIAWHRDDLENAIKSAEEAARQTPWLFEARLLQGHLEFEQAVKLYFRRNMVEAAEKAGRADRHYASAQSIAQSSVDSYLGRCGVSGLVLHMALHGLPADIAAAYQQGDESCSRALVVESDNAEAHRLYSEAVRAWGSIKVKDGEDPGNAYERAADLAKRALELSGGDAETLVALADIFLDRAWWESKSGKDPRVTLNQAVTTFEQALTIDPRKIDAANNMGQAFLLRSRFEIAHHLDASDTQDRCVASFQGALAIDPHAAACFRNLARAALARADEKSRRGLDPTTGLQQVLQFIEHLAGDRQLPDRLEAVNKLRSRLDLHHQ